jgi:hypothetical protein
MKTLPTGSVKNLLQRIENVETNAEQMVVAQ